VTAIRSPARMAGALSTVTGDDQDQGA
jgi:hypothetical protein